MPTFTLDGCVPDCVPYDTMYPARSGSALLFHVTVTVAAINSGALEISTAIVASVRSVHTIRLLTSERHTDEFIT